MPHRPEGQIERQQPDAATEPEGPGHEVARDRPSRLDPAAGLHGAGGRSRVRDPCTSHVVAPWGWLSQEDARPVRVLPAAPRTSLRPTTPSAARPASPGRRRCAARSGRSRAPPSSRSRPSRSPSRRTDRSTRGTRTRDEPEAAHEDLVGKRVVAVLAKPGVQQPVGVDPDGAAPVEPGVEALREESNDGTT